MLTLLENIDNIFARAFAARGSIGMKTKLSARDLEINLQSAILNRFGFHLQKAIVLLGISGNSKQKHKRQ